MPKEFDMKKFITENRVTYPVVGTPAIGRPIHRSPHESPTIQEGVEKWWGRAKGYLADAEDALRVASKEAGNDRELKKAIDEATSHILQALRVLR